MQLRSVKEKLIKHGMLKENGFTSLLHVSESLNLLFTLA